jgi:carbonic anhydrase
MSCTTATAPIDINPSKIKGKCHYKCSYYFRYSNSSCVATNRGDYISIAYDKSSSPPVMYNSLGYDVQEIRLYTPSLHSYNNVKTDAELIVVHGSKTGSSPLLVCIPIKSNNTSSNSANFFKTLVDTVASSAPSEGESTTVDAPKFNLNGMVPKKPYFSYTATEPYQPCSTYLVDYIVYAPLQASLDIIPDTLKSLQNIIKTNGYDIKKGPSLFYNEKGPTDEAGDGEIYIDCQPVDASEETTEIVIDSGASFSFKDWIKSPWVQGFFLAIIVFIFLYIVKYVLNLTGVIKGGNSTSSNSKATTA